MFHKKTVIETLFKTIPWRLLGITDGYLKKDTFLEKVGERLCHNLLILKKKNSLTGYCILMKF